MLLYLIRHAHAVAADENRERPLSLRGRGECARVAAFLGRTREFTPLEFWHSPLARARETAELLRAALAPQITLREHAGLLPEDDPAVFAARLTALAPTAALAVAGHEPHLSALATLLVCGRAAPIGFEFEKAAVLALDAPSYGLPAHADLTGRFAVRWHLSPALLPA
jgi:phosphohistidine phosphatase